MLKTDLTGSHSYLCCPGSGVLEEDTKETNNHKVSKTNQRER
jgi:hypothetical protein